MDQIRCFAPEEDTRGSAGGVVDHFDSTKELCKTCEFCRFTRKTASGVLAERENIEFDRGVVNADVEL